MGDQLLPLPLIERTATRAWTCSGFFGPKARGRRHGWTGSCQSWRRSRTVIPKERFLPASFRPSVQTKCRGLWCELLGHSIVVGKSVERQS